MSESGMRRRHYLMFDFSHKKWHEEGRESEVSRTLPADGRKRGHKVAGPWTLRLSGEPVSARSSPTPEVGDDRETRNGKALHSLVLVDDDLPKLVDACKDDEWALTRVGIDLRIHGADYWDPATSTRQLFGNRSAAHRLMGLPPPKANRKKFGKVNVVIVDQGIDSDEVNKRGGKFAGGWQSPSSPVPGNTKGGHGSMLVRNVLSVAPGATIFDLPLISAAIADVPTSSAVATFLSDAHAAFEELFASIRQLRDEQKEDDHQWKQPWVILNAWAVFNNGNEHKEASREALNYASNPTHPLNESVGKLAVEHDVVFAAGNCGQFCPSSRCGAYNVGPGHSILGANSLPDVLTVGAVRTDGLWLGYSSQGPGALQGSVPEADEKPDVCAPSQFSEDDDENTGNTGTSTASALVAGFVARYRADHGNAFTPRQLRQEIRKMAAKVEESDPAQYGRGIVHWQ
jgi:hypothetical protein